MTGIYKIKHPVLAKDPMNFFDLGYMGMERFSGSNQHLVIQEKERKGSHRFPERLEQGSGQD